MFVGANEAIYDTKFEVDMPESIESHNGRIHLKIKSIDPATGQINLGYHNALQKHVRNKDPRVMTMPSPFENIPNPWAKAPEILVDNQGRMVRAEDLPDEAYLPYFMGPIFQLPLVELPNGSDATWKKERDLTLAVITKERRFGFRGPSWAGPPGQESTTRLPGKEVVNFTMGPVKGDTRTITRQYEMATLEKNGANPKMKQSGTATYVFDFKRGLVLSAEFKHTMEYNESNATVRIPITASIKLMSEAEYAKFLADAATARENVRVKRLTDLRDNPRRGELTAKDAPADSVKSEYIGAGHGADWTKVSPEGKPMVGLRVELAVWAGKAIFRRVDPAFERTEQNNSTVTMAKEGYVVAAMHVSATEFANAVRFTYAKYENGKLNMNDTYTGPWLGKIEQGNKITKLGGTGAPVIGIFGKNGMNIHGMGLVSKASENAEADPKSDIMPASAFKPTWQPGSGKVSDLLNEMGTEAMLGNDDVYNLTENQDVESIARIKVPSTFRIVVLSDGSEFTLRHAGEPLTLNRETTSQPQRPRAANAPSPNRRRGSAYSEAGSDASGNVEASAAPKKAPPTGMLPVKKWVAIEWVVKPQEMIVYIDGDEWQRIPGDFGAVETPLNIRASKGVLKVRSVDLVQ